MTERIKRNKGKSKYMQITLKQNKKDARNKNRIAETQGVILVKGKRQTLRMEQEVTRKG